MTLQPAVRRKIRFASSLPMLHIHPAYLPSEPETVVKNKTRKAQTEPEETVNFQSEATTMKDGVCLSGLRGRSHAV